MEIDENYQEQLKIHLLQLEADFEHSNVCIEGRKKEIELLNKEIELAEKRKIFTLERIKETKELIQG
jgi:hypothetical protein